jgi:hypothetical protein
MSIRPYTIRDGDTLWGIAGRKLGDTKLWGDIWRMNIDAERLPNNATLIVDPDVLFTGDTIYIPKDGSKLPRRAPMPMARSLRRSLGERGAQSEVTPPRFEFDMVKVTGTAFHPDFRITLTLVGAMGMQAKDPVRFLDMKPSNYEMKEATAKRMILSRLFNAIRADYRPEAASVTLDAGQAFRSAGGLTARLKVNPVTRVRTGQVDLPSDEVRLYGHRFDPLLSLKIEIQHRGQSDEGASEGNQSVQVALPITDFGVDVFITADPSMGQKLPSYALASRMLTRGALGAKMLMSGSRDVVTGGVRMGGHAGKKGGAGRAGISGAEAVIAESGGNKRLLLERRAPKTGHGAATDLVRAGA